jgi:dihydroorotate dehydrogenase electron transfer subunit
VRLETGTVTESIRLAKQTVRLSARVPGLSRRIDPGQFFMLRGWEGSEPLLRRPFSVCDREGEVISFLIKVTGPGTRLLTELGPGEPLSLLGPLGRGFAPDRSAARHLMVAGGVGLAPFPLLARALAVECPGAEIELLYGDRDASRMIPVERLGFRGLRVERATEDGSVGERGLVVRLVEERLAADDRPVAIYACGPSAMMKAIRERADGCAAGMQFSLESRMGCGLGSCMACVVAVRKGPDTVYERVCHAGPVFDGMEVVF